MNENKTTGWHRTGEIVQGLILGMLLFAGIYELIKASTLDQVFRYQGF